MIDWLLSLSTLQIAIGSLVLLLLVALMLLAVNDPRRYR